MNQQLDLTKLTHKKNLNKLMTFIQQALNSRITLQSEDSYVIYIKQIRLTQTIETRPKLKTNLLEALYCLQSYLNYSVLYMDEEKVFWIPFVDNKTAKEL